MSATPDNTATTAWRDLADQLTPDQVAELEYFERASKPPVMASPESRLRHARKYAQLNMAAAVLADLPLPADAVIDDGAAGSVGGWTDWAPGVYLRTWVPWSHPVCEVSITGQQDSDGAVRRWITAEPDVELSAPSAREFAAALIAAAEYLEGLQ